MSEQSELVKNNPTRSLQLGIKELIDKYGEYRHSAYHAALTVFLVSAVLAAVSRSPSWVIKFKEVAGLVPDSAIGLTGGMMPIFGPLVIYLLFLYFYTTILETLRLRQGILPRLTAHSSEAERVLLEPPLLLGAESSLMTRTTAYIWLVVSLYGPLLCYLFLFIDFCFYLEFDGKVIGRGYELFYTFHEWGGIWPTGHFGVKSPLPPVYPIWQPILYTLIFLHLGFLATDLIRRLLRNRSS